MCLLFCFVIFWMMCCIMCGKKINKKMLITKIYIKILRWGFFLKGTGLREVSNAFFPLLSLLFHKRHLLSESEIQPSAAFVLCRF